MIGRDHSNPKRRWRMALSRPVMRRAAVTAAIVGPAIALINHGDRLFTGQMLDSDWLRVAISFLVPYAVATASSILALSPKTEPSGQRPSPSGTPL